MKKWFEKAAVIAVILNAIIFYTATIAHAGSWTEFSTGNILEAAELNANQDYRAENMLPVSATGVETDITYELGSSTYRWKVGNFGTVTSTQNISESSSVNVSDTNVSNAQSVSVDSVALNSFTFPTRLNRIKSIPALDFNLIVSPNNAVFAEFIATANANYISSTNDIDWLPGTIIASPNNDDQAGMYYHHGIDLPYSSTLDSVDVCYYDNDNIGFVWAYVYAINDSGGNITILAKSEPAGADRDSTAFIDNLPVGTNIDNGNYFYGVSVFVLLSPSSDYPVRGITTRFFGVRLNYSIDTQLNAF